MLTDEERAGLRQLVSSDKAAARVDYEHVRRGTANVFVFCGPLAGKRRVKITERRTKVDWAASVRELMDQVHPQAERIVLVMDNLNTHAAASLYEAFPPAEAKRIVDRLEIHDTPKHGSWLNPPRRTEIELGMLGRQGLDRRIDHADQLRHEAAAWETNRNAQANGVNWRFTTADARIKLRRLYPSIEG
jgi:hypothetical protein